MWSRDLFFAEQSADAAPPMWNRPSQSSGRLISLEPVVADRPMWHRPLVHRAEAVPIFEEAVVSPSHMWHRAPTGAPMCPCCVTPTQTGLAMAEAAEAQILSPPRSPVSHRPSTRSTRRSSESAFSVSTNGSTRRVRTRTSNLSLRIKNSFARLRGRSSTNSM